MARSVDPQTERIDLEKEFLDQRTVGKRKADRRNLGKRSISVKIGGHEYRIRSDGDEEWLQRVAASVDDAMRRIREHTSTVDSLDVAILTSLNLARELLQLREEGVASAGSDPGALRELIELVESEFPADESS